MVICRCTKKCPKAKKETSSSLVAEAHCILTIKFACSCFLHKYEQNIEYKMIFHPEHAENISYVYLVNQIFEVVSDSFSK